MVKFDIHEVDRNKILNMMREEQKIRYSKGIQELYTKQYYAKQTNPEYATVNIEREIQKFILRVFQFDDDDASLAEYWKIPSTYWNDEEIKNSIFYMKLNIFQYPKVSVNEDMIDTHLIEYKTGNEISLSSLQTSGRPLVILAGSMT